MVRRAEKVNPRAAAGAAEAAGHEVDVTVARSREVVHRNPFFILGTPARRSVDRGHPGGAVIIGTKHLDGSDAEAEGGEVKTAGCIVAREHRVACVAARVGRQGSAIGKCGAAICGPRKSGELVGSTRIGAGIVEADDDRGAKRRYRSFTLSK